MFTLSVAAGNASAEGLFIGEYSTQRECLQAADRWMAWNGSSDVRSDCVYKRMGTGWELWIRSVS